MRHCILLVVLVVSSGGAIAAEETTRTLFSKYSGDLEGAWQNYGSDKQKDARDKLITDLKDAFTVKITKAAIPPNLKMSNVISHFLDRIAESRTLFRLEKMKTTRIAYEAGCQLLFKREFPGSVDIAETRTTQQAFDLAMRWFEDARDAVRQSSTEAQTLTYNTINEAVTLVIKGATIPDIDHIAQLDKNLQEARKRFPTGSPVLAKVNSPILNLLEARAKDIQSRAVKK
jgi:hypothetical protein